MTQTFGPFESHPVAMPVQGRQRYWGPVALNFNARVINVVTPAVLAGNRLNLSNYQVSTVYVTVSAGAGSAVRVEFGCFDLDDATLLRTELLTAGAAVGTTSAFDFGTGAAALLRGRVFRAHDLRCARQVAGGVDPVVTLRLYARS